MFHASLKEVVTELWKWLYTTPIIQTLIIMMVLDIVSGILVGAVQKKLNSTISFRGITRKAFMVILVGLGSLIEPFAQGMPMGQIVAGFYIFTEGLSIIENASLLGVPLPRSLIEMLQKVREDQQRKLSQKLAESKIELTVPPQAEASVKIETHLSKPELKLKK